MRIKSHKPGWILHRFEDFVENVREQVMPTPEDSKDYVGLEHLDSGSLHIRRWGTEIHLKGTKFRMKKGDLLFARRNAYLRRIAIAPHDGLFSAHGMVFRPKTDVVSPDFLPFFLSSDMFLDRAIKISVGSLSPTINWGTLRHEQFSLPSLSEQKRFSDLLWVVEEAQEKYSDLTNKYETWVEAYSTDILCVNGIGFSKKATSRTANINKKWQLKTVEEIAPLQRGFDLPSSRLNKGKWPVAYSNGICNFHSEYKVKGPGVFTGRSGTIGNIFYVEGNYWPHNTTLWVTDFKGNYPRFIYYLYKKLRFDKKQEGTGVPTLNRNYIHKIRALIPTHDEQVKIAKKLDSLHEIYQETKNLTESISRIKKKIINQIFG